VIRLPERVVIGTKNPDKLAEMIAVLGAAVPGLEVVEGESWPDVDETGATLAENALLKARAVAEATGHAAIADDTGLEVDALGGRPGVHTARFAGPAATYAENRQRMLSEMAGVDAITVEGVLEGRIATTERGTFGFGYDSIFEVSDRTLAEIPEVEKNRISHRAVAIRALADMLAAAATENRYAG